MGSLMGLGKWINSWGKLYSQNALHVESAKQIFTTIPILVVEHALSLRHVFNVFALFFPVSCQSQSGVSLSLHLWSKMKIYLLPQKQLDMEEYRFLWMKPKYCWVIFNIHWVITFWRSPIWREISALWMLHNVDITYIFNGSHLKLLSYVSIHTCVCIKTYIDEFKWKKSLEVAQQKCML